MEWYVVYTKPRWENRVTGDLQKSGIEAYCPTITEVRQWSDRKKKVTTALFKSYVFVRIPAKDRTLVFQSPGVVQYLYWLGKPAVVRDAEIKTIKQWIDNDRVDEIETTHLTPGDKITIAKGKFKGREAIVNNVGKKRMRLILKEMGFVVSVRLGDVV